MRGIKGGRIGAWSIVWSLVCPAGAVAAEGMWTLDHLPREALQQQYGFEPDARWVQQAMQSSVRLASGCSGSFVSGQGLVLTNAHCVLQCAHEQSDDAQDIINDGFIAAAPTDEMRCPSEELNRLDQIVDVTAQIEKATTGLRGRAFVEARNAEKARIESECVGQAAAVRRCDVVELYGGSQYQLYRYHRYQDVRLVFVPEYRSSFFGGDPDNFNFPRYSFDMALLRAYEDGKPAMSDAHFSLKPEGAKVGELVMVTGHPGRTQRQLTVAQLQRLRDVNFIDSLAYLSERRALLWQYGRSGDAARRHAQADLTLTENSLKVIRGQLDALRQPGLLESKRKQEAELRAYAQQQRQADAAEADDPWGQIEQAQMAYRDLAAAYQMLEVGRGFDSRYFEYARQLVRAAEERAKPSPKRLREYQDAALPRLQQTLLAPTALHPRLETARLAWSLGKLREKLGADAPLVKLVLARDAPETLAGKLVSETRLGDAAFRQQLWEGGFDAVTQSTDPFIQLARAVDSVSRDLRQRYEKDVEAVEARAAASIASLRFAQSGTSTYPDATFTLRLSYGEVQGWHEQGKTIAPFTNVQGLYSRATGAEPFALAPRWRKARSRLEMNTRFNFVTTNDIIGGNSGSPVINRDLQVVGLVFDGNIHSLGGAFGYQAQTNRCVAVHSAVIVEALDKVYGAQHLLRELLPASGAGAASADADGAAAP
ncbi:S46 family peptidase [Sinimarinibacterium sp. NLF-5-8]|uniref:S46 family peptidase n=1 Tax=Sinimarinibacterium sp. NLF-5-8 TaxID=2698684 RepID=UPI00137BB92C|nr:S46 family peptidase [Sinimarinibacterium sp. NLF-5-8]QHS09768.1 S46 family peptidase [Sinimarinibacterium sp. NLF-5-8]